MMLQGWLRFIVFAVMRFSGLPFICRELLQRRRVTILCYHEPQHESAARHFTRLKSLYNIISLREYVEWRSDPKCKRLPPKALILTLDDGHRSNTELRSLLYDLNVPVTIFVCTAIIGTRRHYWWKEVTDPRLAQELKRVSNEVRLARLKEEAGFAETTEFKEPQALTFAETKALATLADIQSHTRFHPVLPRCTAERASNEIIGSKIELERVLSASVYAIAYPNGDYGAREVRLARGAGYRCGLGLRGGYNSDSTDMFGLRRIAMVDTAGLNEVVVRTSGLWSMLERLTWSRRGSGAHAPNIPADQLV